MNRSHSLALTTAFAVFATSLITGCSNSSSSDAGSNGSTSSQGASVPSATSEAVTRAATDFLDAVIKGDTQRASARLTPQAMQRIVASGKQFTPPGLETATFKIGEVRTPTTDRAIVSCTLTDNSTGNATTEEMCCVLKFVENDWRVAGIAYWAGPDLDGTMSDFETGQSTPIPRNMSPTNMAGPATTPAGVPATQTNPPRVATEPAATSPY